MRQPPGRGFQKALLFTAHTHTQTCLGLGTCGLGKDNNGTSCYLCSTFGQGTQQGCPTAFLLHQEGVWALFS